MVWPSRAFENKRSTPGQQRSLCQSLPPKGHAYGFHQTGRVYDRYPKKRPVTFCTENKDDRSSCLVNAQSETETLSRIPFNAHETEAEVRQGTWWSAWSAQAVAGRPRG